MYIDMYGCFARHWSTFRVFSFTKIYLYRQSQYSKPWLRKCYIPVAQWPRSSVCNQSAVGSTTNRGVQSSTSWNFDCVKNESSPIENGRFCRAWLVFRVISFTNTHTHTDADIYIMCCYVFYVRFDNNLRTDELTNSKPVLPQFSKCQSISAPYVHSNVRSRLNGTCAWLLCIVPRILCTVSQNVIPNN